MTDTWSKLADDLGYLNEQSMWVCLYQIEGLSIPELSKRLGHGTHTIRRRLILHKVERRQRGGPRVMTYQRQRLFRVDQRALWMMTTVRLSEVLGVSTAVVTKYKQLMRGDRDGFLYNHTDRGTGEIRNALETTPGVVPNPRPEI